RRLRQHRAVDRPERQVGPPRDLLLRRDRPHGDPGGCVEAAHRREAPWLLVPMEKMTPDAEEWGYVGRKFLGAKLWAPTAAVPFLAEHLKSLTEFPPSQGADTLSMKKAIDGVMKKMEPPHGGSN